LVDFAFTLDYQFQSVLVYIFLEFLDVIHVVEPTVLTASDGPALRTLQRLAQNGNLVFEFLEVAHDIESFDYVVVEFRGETVEHLGFVDFPVIGGFLDVFRHNFGCAILLGLQFGFVFDAAVGQEVRAAHHKVLVAGPALVVFPALNKAAVEVLRIVFADQILARIQRTVAGSEELQDVVVLDSEPVLEAQTCTHESSDFGVTGDAEAVPVFVEQHLDPAHAVGLVLHV